MAVQIDAFEGVMIPTYIINLKKRSECLNHILNQFEGKPEFNIKVVEACEYKIEEIGLWQSMVKVINIAIHNKDDVIIICNNDHEFTGNYTKEYLFQNIIEANEQGCAILAGGIGSFGHAVPLTVNRMWVNPFQSTQFIVLYKNIFEKILTYKFKKNEATDLVLAQMTSHKMVLYPFISRKRGYCPSDCTTIHNEKPGLVQNMFQKTEERLRVIQNAYLKYYAK